VDTKFAYYFLLANVPLLESLGTGTTFKELSGGKLKEVPFRFPELSEQRRIVAILDEAFEGIATAKANAEKNLRNARELFLRQLQLVFSPARAGWVASTLGATYDVRDGTHDSPGYHASGYPLITSKNLKRDGLSFDDVKLIADADYRKINERSAVHKGDVLFAMIGTIGNPTVVEVEPEFAIKNVALFKVAPGQSGHFLRYFLSSQGVVSKMTSEAKGTTQKFVGLGYLRAFPISVPPAAEQAEVVRELDDLAAETDRLEAIYGQKLAALDELKKSLLHQAFSGLL
jgi:type I restriction enzyme S subunit